MSNFKVGDRVVIVRESVVSSPILNPIDVFEGDTGIVIENRHGEYLVLLDRGNKKCLVVDSILTLKKIYESPLFKIMREIDE